ncbi:Interleukin-20 [Merluccius polli]|uniref:Interleukin-20 n=1 Tax=Merluccius polli TaxID=89951 RepID=A0AA47PCM3_MERPO|nr:Interleukin-20 [Merluccius polli]
MKVLSVCLLVLIASLAELAQSRKLHLVGCTVGAHTGELRKYYNEMRTDVLRRDSEMAVRFLSTPTLRNIQLPDRSEHLLIMCQYNLTMTSFGQEDQTCCFLQLLLRFYIERVFSRYSSSGLEDQRSASALANAFFSIRRDLTPCNCQCEEETHRLMDSVHSEFIQLNVKLAAVKAVGELDTVLDWLEGFRRPGLTGHPGRK